MPSRWTELELAERTAANPAVKLASESPRKRPIRQSATIEPLEGIAPAERSKRRKAAYSMSEADLLKCVLDLAKLKGWLVAHFRPAQTSKGWRTAVSADGFGFPDLVMVRHDRCLFVELKAERGKLSEAQSIWLGFLTGANQRGRVFIWKPSDWLSGEIERRLE